MSKKISVGAAGLSVRSYGRAAGAVCVATMLSACAGQLTQLPPSPNVPDRQVERRIHQEPSEQYDPSEAVSVVDRGYNFDWRMIGAAGVLPYQVFDDGQRIYLQFPTDGRIPAIFSESAAGTRLIVPRIAMPYLVVDGTANVLVFRLGRFVGKAVRVRRGVPPAGVMTGLASPRRVTGMAMAPQSIAFAQAVARGDQRVAADLNSEAGELIGSAVGQPLHIEANPAATWTLRKEDRDVAGALARWSKVSGWRIQWDTKIVAMITDDSTLTGSLDSALAAVVGALQSGGYPLKLSPPDRTSRSYRIYEATAPSILAEVKQ
ncbi:TrbG/VirB9 family P-type conjugative transfer protein [Burkholderia cenocepacia]|uniref:TrbG/VirB9 family P-type conjugative transfer protein n=1 Tax=Burkholderia cenocepacia TaxID=95486 RepID=UPI00222EF16F|nr:TrbG/VirB9 family P-type conjugative transfer protein [Burkholderia cenocepacia]MCW3677836.1 TrbG/VirB9 family P-type conjugative transfer protein [Burkholderia cenocepacia]